MKFEKGQSGNPTGKEKGLQNKTTKKAKELILASIDMQSVYFNRTMQTIRKKNPVEWAKIMVKMMEFVLPKRLDITSDDKPILDLSKLPDGYLDRIIGIKEGGESGKEQA